MSAGTSLRPSYLGARVPRLEDERLLSGHGQYVADIQLPGMLEATIVRSTAAHARIRSVELGAARDVPGVIDVVSGADLTDIEPFPDFFEWARPVRQLLLAQDRVRYVGAPVVAVVAENRYAAEDAAELVQIEYEDLPVVSSIEAALAPDAHRLYEDWPDNVMVDAPAKDPAIDEIFGRAAKVIGGTYTIQRHAAVPMEPRGVAAEYHNGRLHVWSSTQFPHITRTMISYILPVPERDIRVIAPDVGGGFGSKAQVYPEERP